MRSPQKRNGDVKDAKRKLNSVRSPEDTDGAVTIFDCNSTEEEKSVESESDDHESDSDSSSPVMIRERRLTRSSNVNYKDKSYIREASTDVSSSDDELQPEAMEMEDEEIHQPIQPMVEALSIGDYYDLRENQHLISRIELDHLNSVNFHTEHSELKEESIDLGTERLSRSQLALIMKKGKAIALSTAKRPARRKSMPLKFVEAIVENGHSKPKPEKPEITTITIPATTEKTSYEDRLLAKNRVTYKIKAHQHPKSVGRKLKKLEKKVIMSKKEAMVPVEPEQSISVRKELKRIFMESGFPEWKHFPNQEKLAEEALQKIQKEFPEWMSLLRSDFNIVLYGYGSKICIFEELQKYLDDEFTVMEIDGTMPKVDPVEVLSQFVSLCLIIKHSLKGSSFYAKVRNLLPKLRPLLLHPPVFLFIRNLEQICAKNDQLFYLITHLAALPFVHMVASCDHYNSPLIFDQGMSTDMALIWKRCVTYAPYKAEAKVITGAFTAEAFEESSSRVTLGHVYGAVTLKSKRTFNILASLQLQAVKSKQYDSNTWSGIEFGELARLCREKFIANNDTQLNTLLLEFIDNKIIVRSRSDAGAAANAGRGLKGVKKNVENCLRIAVDDAKLEEFIIANPVQND